jgi:hypothetical protein
MGSLCEKDVQYDHVIDEAALTRRAQFLQDEIRLLRARHTLWVESYPSEPFVEKARLRSFEHQFATTMSGISMIHEVGTGFPWLNFSII